MTCPPVWTLSLFTSRKKLKMDVFCLPHWPRERSFPLAVYSGISKCNLQRLQLKQNADARILTSSKSYEHITPVLAALHLFHTSFIIDFNILLTDCCLRSSSKALLTAPKSQFNFSVWFYGSPVLCVKHFVMYNFDKCHGNIVIIIIFITTLKRNKGHEGKKITSVSELNWNFKLTGWIFVSLLENLKVFSSFHDEQTLKQRILLTQMNHFFTQRKAKSVQLH